MMAITTSNSTRVNPVDADFDLSLTNNSLILWLRLPDGTDGSTCGWTPQIGTTEKVFRPVGQTDHYPLPLDQR
jgi:hypothetical protein